MMFQKILRAKFFFSSSASTICFFVFCVFFGTVTCWSDRSQFAFESLLNEDRRLGLDQTT